MRTLSSWLLTAFVVSVIGTYMRGSGDSHLPDNAPPGAIEYFEGTNGSDFIALYKDKIEFQIDGLLGGSGSIPVSHLKSVKKMGNTVYVNSTDGQLQFNLTGFSNLSTLRRFTDEVQELIDKRKKPAA